MANDPALIGRFRITRKLGEGGMGVVYAAHDDRLDRAIAIKTIRHTGDSTARARFWQEARAAASVSHPNICSLYEVGEAGDSIFFAMELLEGESLAARLARGSIAAAEAVQIMLSLLSALGALHDRGIVHRDLKPSNVFLTPFGLKLLDFGVAMCRAPDVETRAALTSPDAIVGTVHYMSPEQARSAPVDGRADIFAAGLILFEMLAGRRAFDASSAVQVLHAILHEPPPTLTGTGAIPAIDRVIRRALAKNAADRYQTAAEMAADLRAADSGERTGDVHARAISRLIVLPFRILRPDADTDFLAFSLPDAITTSLSGLRSLAVRSTMTASKFGPDATDLGRIAREADVDVVVSGTLLRAGPQVRVNTQLVEAPGGTVIWSLTSQVGVGDVFQLQDDLTHRIVESLSLPLTVREQRLLRHDVPQTAKAYEFYLRGNELSADPAAWTTARDLYLECVGEDSQYAPGWARLARVYRLLGKYRSEDAEPNLTRAEAALQRALAINPDLPFAHNLYAQLEVDLGRSRSAMVRLIERATTRAADAEIFAGLVHACRYCGLLDASVAADVKARQLDPAVVTSVVQTYWLLKRYDRVIEFPLSEANYTRTMSLALLGRARQALDELDSLGQARVPHVVAIVRAFIEGKPEDGIASIKRTFVSARDPESFFYWARHLAYLGEHETALDLLERSARLGYACYPVAATDPWLDGLRGDPRFEDVVRRMRDAHEQAQSAFVVAGGEQVLDVRGAG